MSPDIPSNIAVCSSFWRRRYGPGRNTQPSRGKRSFRINCWCATNPELRGCRWQPRCFRERRPYPYPMFRIVYLVQVPPGAPPYYSTQLSQNPLVEYVEPNRIRHTTLAAPNDSLFVSDQWDLTKIQAQQAWQLIPGIYLTSGHGGRRSHQGRGDRHRRRLHASRFHQRRRQFSECGFGWTDLVFLEPGHREYHDFRRGLPLARRFRTRHSRVRHHRRRHEQRPGRGGTRLCARADRVQGDGHRPEQATTPT